MLFRKKIPRSCTYCAFGTMVSDEEVLCTKRGIVSVCHHCRKFKYEPCKRVPPKASAVNFSKYNDTDFTL